MKKGTFDRPFDVRRWRAWHKRSRVWSSALGRERSPVHSSARHPRHRPQNGDDNTVPHGWLKSLLGIFRHRVFPAAFSPRPPSAIPRGPERNNNIAVQVSELCGPGV
jgi:hypothetical protein